ncbi:MAG: prepilin-type N-terminal cleavage/methylation domain-containing protein [Pseudomonadota bacterium]
MNHNLFCNFRSRSQSGFTLLEILLTVAIISIFVIVATVAVSAALTSFWLNGATSKMLADIRYAQQQARARNGWYGIRFQANPVNRYNVYSTDGSSDTDVPDPANLSQVLDVDVAADFGGIRITSVAIAAGNKAEFNPVGVPYDDALGSPLLNDATIILSLGGSTRTIKIIKNTGRAELQ